MEISAVEKAAATLLLARRENRQLRALPSGCSPQTVDEGYEVQSKLLQLTGDPGCGWLLGLTNPYMQRLFGVDGPYYARLLSTGHAKSPQTLHADDFCTLGIECEVTFCMGADLPPIGRLRNRGEVSHAVATVHPSVEIVDAHFEDWLNAPLANIIADNGTDGLLVVGPGLAWPGPSLDSCAVTLIANGAEIAAGNAREVMGSPVNALTWLSNKLNSIGLGLQAGELINTGTCTELRFVEAGDRVSAVFSGLGEASVAFL